MPGFLIMIVAVLTGLSVFYHRPADPSLFPAPSGKGVDIYLLDNGFHTDLVLPRDKVMAHGGPLAMAVRTMPKGDWIYVGWGDGTFYVEEGPVSERWVDGLRALMGRGQGSVMRLEAARNPQQRFEAGHVQTLTLSAEGLAALMTHMDASLRLDASGQPQALLYRPSDRAYFWKSDEVFWIGHLCNHWTLQGLEAGGLKVWPWRPMTSGEVMRTARQAQARAAALDLRPIAH